MLERTPKYTLRKLSVGLASVMIGSGILINSPKVLADTTDKSTSQPSSTVVQPSSQANQAGQPSSQNEDKSKINVPSNTTQDKNTGSKPSENKLVETSAGTPASIDQAPKPTTGDVEAKQKSEQTKTPDPFTPAKPTDNPDADPETTPLVNQKVNDQPVKAQKGASFEAYITAKDKSTGQEYVTSYLGNDKAMSTINLDLVDPNSLEYHVIYHNGGETFNPNFYIGTGNGYSGPEESNMYVDESRINDQNKLIQTKASGSHNVNFRVGNTGTYVNYDEYLKKYKGQGLSAWRITGFTLNANDTASVTIPIKFRSTKSEGIGVVDQALYWTTGPEKFQSQVSLVNQTVFENEKKYIPAKPTDIAEINGKKPAIYNEGISDAPAISDNGNVAYVYFTGKDFNGNEFVSNYLSPTSKNVDINFGESDPNALDPNTLELHMIYQNKSNKEIWNNFRLTSPAAAFGVSGSLTIDTSRINDENSKYFEKSGSSYQLRYKVSNSGETYITYDQWKAGKDTTYKDKNLILAWSGWAVSKLGPGDSVTAVVPVRIEPGQNQKLGLIDWQGHTINLTGKVNVTFSKKRKLDFAKPTTGDEATTTTGVYNNPDATSSESLELTNGEAIAYYTAKGKDGKTYVTGYVGEDGKSQSIFNVDQIYLNTLEYHLIYRQYDNNENKTGLWASFADGKTIVADQERIIRAGGLKLKSDDGHSYNWSIGDGRNYYSYADYLMQHDNSLKKATQISLTSTEVKAGDTIEMTIPVKYVGQLSDRQQSLVFSPQVNDHGTGYHSTLYFTTVRKDVSKIKKIVLIPSEFVSEQPGQSNWKLVKEIEKDMPNGRDAFKISNFPTYKGSFNMDSLPKGDLPSVVYGTAQWFIDLSKIQEIFANHGYTVKYATNNGKAQEMPFYAYDASSVAIRVDDDDGDDGDGKPVSDPSILVIHVQAVPAIILNKDQHYVADPNAKPWDTTSMIDEIYAADDAGQRKTRDQLTKLPKTDVDISYEYQAPGAAKAVAAAKVDLTKAGVYTVTYSHTYADGRVVKDSRKVYVDDAKQETKDITRTIIVHAPNGTDQTVIQKATLTQEVILDATTGKIKSEGEWSTAMWKAYSAPEFKGYTPDKAQVDETTVNENTQDTTVEISYTANETPAQPGHSKDKGNNDNNGGNNSGGIVPINPSDNNSNNSNTAPTDNKKTDDTKKDNTGKKITKETPKKVKNNKSNKTKSTTTSKSNQSSKTKRTTQTKKPTRTNRTDDISPKASVMNMTKRTTKSGTISPKAVALANTTAGPATSAKANMENGIAKNNSQNSQTLPQTGENESEVAFAVAGLLAAALGIFGIAINRKKEN